MLPTAMAARSVLNISRCSQCLKLNRHAETFTASSSSIQRRFLQQIKTKNHYETLGISNGATSNEIRDAFVKSAKEVHPDVNPNDPKGHEKFVELSKAYQVLSKTISRSEYDDLLRRGFTETEQPFSRHPYGPSNYRPKGNTEEDRYYEMYWRARAEYEKAYYSTPHAHFKQPEPDNRVFILIFGVMCFGAVMAYARIELYNWSTKAHSDKHFRESRSSYREQQALMLSKSRDERKEAFKRILKNNETRSKDASL